MWAAGAGGGGVCKLIPPLSNQGNHLDLFSNKAQLLQVCSGRMNTCPLHQHYYFLPFTLNYKRKKKFFKKQLSMRDKWQKRNFFAFCPLKSLQCLSPGQGCKKWVGGWFSL